MERRTGEARIWLKWRKLEKRRSAQFLIAFVFEGVDIEQWKLGTEQHLRQRPSRATLPLYESSQILVIGVACLDGI